MVANVSQQDTNTHGMWLSHARTRQSFFDTTHKKWSEWKTNRSAVITGRFRRKWQGGGGSLKPSDLKRGNWKKKFSSKSSYDHRAPGSFPFWPLFVCGVCYLNPVAPLHPVMFILVSLRQCSSNLILSASTHFIVRVLSACVICTLPHHGILWFSFV